MSSKVYFLDDRAGKLSDSIPFKLVKVLRDAGLADVVKPGDKVGIKIHFGEWGNALNLRPHWVSAVVDEVKRLGAEPTIVETCVAPYGEYVSRFTKEDHLRTAKLHGFTEETMGCPIDIVDGECGIDDVEVEVPHGVYLKKARMGKGFLKYDQIVVVSHFKGHPMGVFGGALKNVGIGMSSGRGKLAAHLIVHHRLGFPGSTINQEAVAQFAAMPHPNLIDRVVESDPRGAYKYEDGVLKHEGDPYDICGYEFGWMFSGIYNLKYELMVTWPPALVDAASAYIHKIGKENMIFASYAMDIAPACDCVNFTDKALVPNLGVFASRDPVALDMACMEMAEEKAATPGSVADEYGFGAPNTERFTNCSSMAKLSQWAQMNAGVHDGIGTSEYTLIRSKTADSDEFAFPPYTLSHTPFIAHKELFKKVHADFGEYTIQDTPIIPQAELDKKPVGKVADISIDDE